MRQRKIFGLAIYLLIALGSAAENPPDPEIEALRTKTNAAIDANKNDEALPLALELLALKRRKLGPEHLDVARSLNALGMIHDRLGNSAEAEKLLHEALEMRLKLAGPEDPLIAESALTLGQFLVRAGRWQEAEPWLEKAVKIRDQKFGDNVETSAALQAQAELYYAWKKYDKAQAPVGRAARIRSAILTWPDPRTAASFDYLAAVEALLKHPKEAATARQQSFWSYEALYGLANPQTLQSGRLLAENLIGSGDLAGARALYERLEKDWDAQRPDPIDRARMLLTRGGLLKRMGDLEAAAAVFRRIIVLADKIPQGLDSGLVMDANSELANCLFDLHRYPEAEVLYLDRLARFEKMNKAEDARNLHEWLGYVYATAGEPVMAEKHYRESLALAEKLPNQPNPAVIGAATALGNYLKNNRRYAEAEELLKRALEVEQKLKGTDSAGAAARLSGLGDLFRDEGKYEQAQTWFEETLRVCEKVLGREHPDTVQALRDLGDVLETRKDFQRAESLYREALQRSEAKFGLESEEVAPALIDLGIFYRRQENFNKAEVFFLRALEVRRKTYGDDDKRTIRCMSDLAECYRQKSDYAKAVEWQQCVIEGRQRVSGAEHPDTIAGISRLGAIYEEAREFSKAIELRGSALALAEKVYGPGTRQTIEHMTNLAATYAAARDFIKAEPLYRKALQLRTQTDGLDAATTAVSCSNLAWCCKETLHFKESQALYEHALQIREKLFGPDSVQAVDTLDSLAEMFEKAGDLTLTLEYRLRIVASRERSLGPTHAATGEALFNLGNAQFKHGDLSSAVKTLERSVTILEGAYGREHIITARAISWLGVTQLSRGDLASAESLLRENVEIQRKLFGPEHQYTGAALSTLGLVYSTMGDYARAEENLRAALAISQRSLGEENDATLAIMTALAGVTLIQGKTEDVALAERAVVLSEEINGPNHPSTGAILKMSAIIHQRMGRLSEARQEVERCLKIGESTAGAESADMAWTHILCAFICSANKEYADAAEHSQRCLTIADKTLGESSLARFIGAKLLATMRLALGDQAGALAASRVAEEAMKKFLENFLSFTSEQQRLAWPQWGPMDLPATLGDAEGLARSVLRFKGIILDSLLEDHLLVAKANLTGKEERLVQLSALKQQLFQLTAEGPAGTGMILKPGSMEHKADAGRLRNEIERLEASMARHSRRSLATTTAQVQAAISSDATLVEVVRYEHVLPDAKTATRYGAVIIPPRGEPRWAPLGSAFEIDKNIILYQKSVRGQTDPATLLSVLHSLYGQIWAPIESLLPSGTRTVILSPDGQLSFVSYATLLAPDEKFAGETYSFRYVASGRDLIMPIKNSNATQTLVFANPDFGGSSGRTETPASGAVEMRSLEMHDLQDLSLPDLPGTAAEAVALEKRAEKSTTVFLCLNATERELRQVNSPRILHLATHGFFLPEMQLGLEVNFNLPPGSEVIPKGKLVNPMHRSGLALAGAQRTLDSWRDGNVPPTDNDGIVTAEEVGGLNLDGTWLVVLSACDTGSGEARAGEGVMGLRRGFVQAGAQNLLMTLWPINDQTTVQIMLDFYDAAEKTKNPPQALADVQRDWLVKLRKERGLLKAVNLAGPFIMSSQGKN